MRFIFLYPSQTGKGKLISIGYSTAVYVIMNHKKFLYSYTLPSLLLLLIMMWGCASMGNPSGGPRDEDPPRFVRAVPPSGSVGIALDTHRISLLFNELVNVKDAFSKVMISPTGASVPRVTSSGRRVTVEFEDSLAPNTTYTIDFADAIQDNNEGNKLTGFFYTFSTGAEIDSLEISGMVLGALDLEPQPQVLVGVYPADAPDSAFFTTPLQRVALTDDNGRFTIPGLKQQPYRIYALKDADADKCYANPEEDLAFLTYPVTPSAERIEVNDTILNLKTGAADTIVTRMRTRFLPNDVLLRMFNTGVRTQYLAKYERKDSTQLYMQFNAQARNLPRLQFPDIPGLENRLLKEYSATNDTVTFWLPRDVASVDTLRVMASFLRPDSARNLVDGTDELEFIFRRPAPAKNKNKKREKEQAAARPATPVLFPSLNTAIQEITQPISIEFPVPLAKLDTAAFRLEQKKDTVWIPVAGQYKMTQADTLSPRRFRIEYPWEFKTTYRLVADSASAVGLYGQVMNTLQTEFSTKDEEDYASLLLDIQGLEPSDRMIVELLGSGDNPLRRLPVKDGKVEFRYLDPGTYYLRMIEDFDGDGKYTPGDPTPGAGQTPPDQAYYYPGKIVLKKNWDVDQTWNPFETPVDAQKPLAIKKTKPKNGRNDSAAETEENEEDYFDPTANPFDPKDVKRKREQARQRANGGF